MRHRQDETEKPTIVSPNVQPGTFRAERMIANRMNEIYCWAGTFDCGRFL
jgi:hypothetical protein